MGLEEASTSRARADGAFGLPRGSFWNLPRALALVLLLARADVCPPPPPAEMHLSSLPGHAGTRLSLSLPPRLPWELLPGILTFPKPLGEAPPCLI